jgi:hypothetical protein
LAGEVDRCAHGRRGSSADHRVLLEIERRAGPPERRLPAFGLDAVHGTMLCDRGNDGYGIDNNQPWKKVYYAVDGTNDLDSRVRAVYQAAGYTPSSCRTRRATTRTANIRTTPTPATSRRRRPPRTGRCRAAASSMP